MPEQQELSVSPPDDARCSQVADLFKMFGDATRVKLLHALLVAQELCVCDLAGRLSISQSAVSHQLRLLKNARLVKARRDGQTIYYSLDDDHVGSILRLGIEHVDE